MRKWQLKENLILSLSIHLLLALMAFFLPQLFPHHQTEVVELSFVEKSNPTALGPPKEVSTPLEVKQVVEQDEKPRNNEKSNEAKFLSAHDQVVKKQTVAKNLGEFKNLQDKTAQAGDGGSPEKIKQIDLKPKMDFTKLADKKIQEERELEKSMEEEALRSQQKQDRLVEAAAQRPGQGGAQASQTTDYLKDIDQGMQTLLSTREFVYYSFYARIRRQLNQHWSGKIREKVSKIFKEGRSIASSEDKVTKLLITLNRQGQLVRVQVLNDSGVRDLDDAAVESFKEAAPFPNPPQGIVDPDGTIKIRWDFILAA